MSPVETAERPAPPAGRPSVLSGWGGTRPASSTLVRVGDREHLAALLDGDAPARGLIPRGAGRSYGDAAQNDRGTVLDMTALCGIASLDPEAGEVTVGAGTTLAAVLTSLAPYGLTLPVVPGTAHVTVGGAIAADIHGKNHPHAGSIGRQLSSFELHTPAAGQLTVSAERDPELFAATLGGMGLTGAITSATLRMIVLRRPYALADIDRVDSLEAALETIERSSHSHSIAWLDLMARGRGFARAVVTRSREGAQSVGQGQIRLAPDRAGLAARLPSGLLRPASVRAFNHAVWLRAPRRVRERPMTVTAAQFPLDGAPGWNRLYGRGGLVQYQVAVPRGQEWVLRRLLELLSSHQVPMYLATLKRLGPESGGMLSFPLEGWTLAVDMPGGAPGLAAALDRADLLVVSAGGRVYLAKDSRMRPETVAAMYPQLTAFDGVRARVDPHEMLRSDLSRRLGLTA